AFQDATPPNVRRRDQSAAAAGRIAEIAPARAGYAVHAGAEARCPAFGRQLFHAGVAVPPDFTGAGATLATGPTDLPPLPPGPEAKLVSAAKLMTASAMTARPRLRYIASPLV